jgi:hypothetical protein
MMFRSGAIVRAGSLSLLALAALPACTPQKSGVNDVSREDAERQELIEAMKRHPALEGNQDAAGKPINVPTTVPKKAAGTDDDHDHPASKPQP